MQCYFASLGSASPGFGSPVHEPKYGHAVRRLPSIAILAGFIGIHALLFGLGCVVHGSSTERKTGLPEIMLFRRSISIGYVREPHYVHRHGIKVGTEAGSMRRFKNRVLQAKQRHQSLGAWSRHDAVAG